MLGVSRKQLSDVVKCRFRHFAGEALIRDGKAPRDVWITSSDDDGATWSEPSEITAQVKPDTTLR